MPISIQTLNINVLKIGDTLGFSIILTNSIMVYLKIKTGYL